jgi:hypothetical protein
MKHSKGLEDRPDNTGRITRPMKEQLAHPEGQDEPIKTQDGDAEYWQSRAERTRTRSRRYKQPAVRDHFGKIAAGYEELARRAHEVTIETDKAEQSPLAASNKEEVAPEPGEHGSRSDERRVLDALEDDEVMEALRANRKNSP